MNAIRAASNSSFPTVVLEELKQSGLTQRLDEAQFFISAFFARISDGDFELHTAREWAVLIADLLNFMQQRQPGHASVRVANPATGHAGRSYIEVVTDDMPFLVDTVTMVAAEHLQIHAVIHPVVDVSRDASGKLLKIGAADGKPESVMHFEVDRLANDDELARLKTRLEGALEDVRVVVADWQKMRDQALAIAADLPSRQLPLDAASVKEASEFLRWLADDNFTFLGYREYEVTQADGDEVLRSMEGSGLGILHKQERSMAPRSLRSLVASELPQSGSTDAIILTKTNARSHVHRPGHMDYIGVLRFDANGKPVAEQRFLGLFSSNAYMARPQDVPLVRHR